jgi:hypothetical protein
MPGNVSVASVVLVQGDDGPTLLFRQASGSTARSRGGSRSSSGSSGKEVHSSVLYTIHKELCGVSDSPAGSSRSRIAAPSKDFGLEILRFVG